MKQSPLQKSLPICNALPALPIESTIYISRYVTNYFMDTHVYWGHMVQDNGILNKSMTIKLIDGRENAYFDGNIKTTPTPAKSYIKEFSLRKDMLMKFLLNPRRSAYDDGETKLTWVGIYIRVKSGKHYMFVPYNHFYRAIRQARRNQLKVVREQLKKVINL